VAARILIVEDSPLVTDAFRVLFTDAGYEVDSAATVAEAIEPDGNGLEILNALRERNSLPRTTLAMTGHNDSKSRRSCLEAGCAEVLLKPVPIGELLRQIERHLA